MPKKAIIPGENLEIIALLAFRKFQFTKKAIIPGATPINSFPAQPQLIVSQRNPNFSVAKKTTIFPFPA
ncbi:MAG: hypothetical protein K6G11_06170 [Lachnospiraceae bacterium]|nr:hypothetical protein [Lachnospiraceae bacterium]